MLSTIANLTYNRGLVSLAQSHGIGIMNVGWEDCARNKNSCSGPLISDLTLNVNGTNMPLMRKPNFADVTSDQDISKFKVVVGNESDGSKTMVTLKEYLESIDKYTGNSKLKSMYLSRDEKILTSAQACILPLSDGEVEFNVKLYNYQSYDEPAVLILVCSSEGTSAQIVNGRDCTLYFNKSGQNANYIAERLTDDRKRRGVPLEGAMTNEEKQRNALLIFQIPLIQKEVPKRESSYFGYVNYAVATSSVGLACYAGPASGGAPYKQEECCSESEESVGGTGGGLFGGDDDDWGSYENVAVTTPGVAMSSYKSRDPVPKARGFENAVIKISEGFGKFIGTEDRQLVRNDKFPIRCTIQYYKVTDTVDINEAMIKEIAEQVNKQYETVTDDERGSLVFGQSERKTEAVLPVPYVPYAFGTNQTMMETL